MIKSHSLIHLFVEPEEQVKAHKTKLADTATETAISEMQSSASRSVEKMAEISDHDVLKINSQEVLNRAVQELDQINKSAKGQIAGSGAVDLKPGFQEKLYDRFNLKLQSAYEKQIGQVEAASKILDERMNAAAKVTEARLTAEEAMQTVRENQNNQTSISNISTALATVSQLESTVADYAVKFPTSDFFNSVLEEISTFKVQLSQSLAEHQKMP
jgi:hypothetical protein